MDRILLIWTVSSQLVNVQVATINIPELPNTSQTIRLPVSPGARKEGWYSQVHRWSTVLRRGHWGGSRSLTPRSPQAFRGATTTHGRQGSNKLNSVRAPARGQGKCPKGHGTGAVSLHLWVGSELSSSVGTWVRAQAMSGLSGSRPEQLEHELLESWWV